jgi:hypothetical protein
VEIALLIGYLACKLGLYCGWCSFGARLHGHQDRLVVKGIIFGAARWSMGMFFGWIAIAAFLNLLSVTVRDGVPLYLLVYVPIRWIEWSLMVPMLDKAGPSLKGLVVGRTAASAYWRLGGIAISCLADVPLILTVGGLPVGRFLC